MTADRTQRYLEQVLALDPEQGLGALLELREQFRRGAGGPAKRVAKREELESALAQLREHFWELDSSELAQRLGALELDDHPDLERARKRLLEVDSHRDELERLAAAPKVDRALLRIFESVLVAPSQRAAQLREQSVGSCATFSRARAARKFVSLARKSAPTLAELEFDWLERLRNARRDHKDSAVARGGLGCLGVFLVFQALRALIFGLGVLYEWLTR